ncbi:MAG: leucine-rich repeat protein [Clostridia bacterium]|nr:leucine-rich repeat protein [Clostridia bacterium]
MAKKTFSKIFAFVFALTLIATSAVAVNADSISGMVSGGIYYATIDGRLTVMDYIGKDEVLDLSEEAVGMKFDAIASYAFGDCNTIKKVIIPENIRQISDSAFRDCTNLEEIVIEDESLRLGACVFKGTAYYNNPLNWEEKVLYLGNILLNINYDKFNKTRYTVKEGTVNIAGYAFCDCQSLKAVKLPDSVKVIGDEAFSFCHNLTDINIPESVTYIGEDMFIDCHDDLKIYGCKGTLAEEYALDNDIRFCSVTYKTVADQELGVIVTLPEYLEFSIDYLYMGELMKRYRIDFYHDGDKIENTPYDITIKIPAERDSRIFLEDNDPETIIFEEVYHEIKEGFATFTVNTNFEVRVGKQVYISTVDEPTGIELEIPENHFFEILKYQRGDEGVYFDKVDELTPEGVTNVLYVVAVGKEDGRMYPNKRVTLSIPVNHKNFIIYNVDFDYNVKDTEALYEDGYLVFDSYDFRDGMALFFLSDKELIPATEDEATKDEEVKDSTADEENISTGDEATTDEPQQGDGTEDEKPVIPSNPSDSSDDEKDADHNNGDNTKDEATKDEEDKKPSDATDDETNYLLGDVNRDGKLNIRDATAIQKNIAKIIEFDKQQIKLADFNCDGKVNVKDATAIQKTIAKII